MKNKTYDNVGTVTKYNKIRRIMGKIHTANTHSRLPTCLGIQYKSGGVKNISPFA